MVRWVFSTTFFAPFKAPFWMISISTTARPNQCCPKRLALPKNSDSGPNSRLLLEGQWVATAFPWKFTQSSISTLLCGVWQLMGCTSLVAGVKAPLAMGKTAKLNCFESQLASVVLQTQRRFRWPNEWCPFLWSPGRKFLWHPFTPKAVELTLALKLSIWKLFRPIHGMMAWSCFTSPTSRCSSTHSNRIPSGK